VVLKKRIRGLKDSKKLTKAQRERLDVIIRQRAVAYGVGWASHQEIDQFGLTAAVRLAMGRAVELTVAQLGQSGSAYTEIIIDGNFNFLNTLPGSHALIKADDTVPAVSAASIIAKVARDRYMAEMAEQYPGYNFETHVGYCTPGHRQALLELGLCDLHRRSFAPVRAALTEASQAWKAA
jgi:ribonuclease HII